MPPLPAPRALLAGAAALALALVTPALAEDETAVVAASFGAEVPGLTRGPSWGSWTSCDSFPLTVRNAGARVTGTSVPVGDARLHAVDVRLTTEQGGFGPDRAYFSSSFGGSDGWSTRFLDATRIRLTAPAPGLAAGQSATVRVVVCRPVSDVRDLPLEVTASGPVRVTGVTEADSAPVVSQTWRLDGEQPVLRTAPAPMPMPTPSPTATATATTGD